MAQAPSSYCEFPPAADRLAFSWNGHGWLIAALVLTAIVAKAVRHASGLHETVTDVVAMLSPGCSTCRAGWGSQSLRTGDHLSRTSWHKDRFRQDRTFTEAAVND